MLNNLEKFHTAASLLWEAVLLGLLWIMFTLLGGVFFGWGPSSCALLSITREKIIKNTNLGYLETISKFWNIYVKEFKYTNIISTTLMLMLFISYICTGNFRGGTDTLSQIFFLFSSASRWITLLIILHIFPLYVHYNLTIQQYFYRAVFTVFSRPILSLFVLAWFWLLKTILTFMPEIAKVPAIYIFAYGLMAINYQVFLKEIKYNDATTLDGQSS